MGRGLCSATTHLCDPWSRTSDGPSASLHLRISGGFARKVGAHLDDGGDLAGAYYVDQERWRCWTPLKLATKTQGAFTSRWSLNNDNNSARAIAVAIACLGTPVWASDLADKSLDTWIATYDSGIIVPEQLTQDVFDAALFIDTRDVDQFDVATIPGATHIEWREVPGRLDDIQIAAWSFFLQTGSLSAQAVFAARLMGHENVLVLQTGLQGWQQNAAYKPE